MYKVSLKKSAERDLDRLHEPILSRIIASIESLCENPRNNQVKKLIQRDNEYRLRIGDYRVLFTIDDYENVIRIARVLHRKDAYKK